MSLWGARWLRGVWHSFYGSLASSTFRVSQDDVHDQLWRGFKSSSKAALLQKMYFASQVELAAALLSFNNNLNVKLICSFATGKRPLSRFKHCWAASAFDCVQTRRLYFDNHKFSCNPFICTTSWRKHLPAFWLLVQTPKVLASDGWTAWSLSVCTNGSNPAR